MFYKRIDLVKLYEAYENEGSVNQAAVDTGNMVEANPTASPTADVQSDDTPSEKVTISKGNTYAFPINNEIEEQLSKLVEQGSGEFRTSTPIKPLLAGPDGENASMKVGGKDLPVYLIVKLVKDKDEKKALSLQLIEDDRVYVALIITPAGLDDILATMGAPTESIKVGVVTPIIQKGGSSIEHSLQIWDPDRDDEQVESDQVTDYDDDDVADGYYDADEEDEVNDEPTEEITVDKEEVMSAPGTAAGFSNESKAPSFSEYLKRQSK